MSKQIKLAAFFLVFSFLFTRPRQINIFASPSLQMGTDSACASIDVVFLVDQSSSMSGANGGVPTDPTEQREHAIKVVIDLLADIALDLCPEVIHRIAVISYGTEIEVDLPLSVLSPDTAAEAEQLRELLKQEIEATNLGQTNPLPAFEEAVRILDEAAPIGDDVRKRAIIFITDGEPCVGDACTNLTFNSAGYARDMQEIITEIVPFDSTLLAQEACLQELRQGIGEGEELPPEARTSCLAQHEVDASAFANSTYVWTILLRSGQPYREELRTIFAEISESHAGRVVDLSNNRQEVPTTFRTILEQLTGVRAARLNCGAFAVNPYLQRARLVFFKFDETVTVSLTYRDTNSTEHVLSSGEHEGGFDVAEYNQQGANERYVLNRPYPGIWELQSENCDGLDAFYDPIAINPGGYNPNIPDAIPQRDRDPFYDPENPIYLEYQMEDETGQPVPQADDPLFAVDIQMTVIDPSGSEETYPMEWVANAGLFRASEPLRVPVTGKYTILVTGKSVEHAGEPTNVGDGLPSNVFNTERVLFDQVGEFDVFPVTGFSIEIVSPTTEAVLRPIHGLADFDAPPEIYPIPIQARIVDRNSQPLTNLTDILLDSENGLEATVKSENNSDTVLLSLSDPLSGLYTGEITSIEDAGEHTLTVQLASDFAPEYYPDSRRDEVDFSRVDEIWYFQIISPTHESVVRPIHQTLVGARQWPLPINPIPVQVALVDANGERHENLEEILVNAPGSLEATVMAGEQTTAIRLEPDLAQPGEYTGEITDFEVAGPHDLAVDLGFVYSESDFIPESVPANIQFTRTDTLFTNPATYTILLALLIAYIIFRIIRYFAIRTNPVRGTIAILDGGTRIAEFGLYSGKNWTVINRRNLRAYPQIDLKKLKASSLKKSKRSNADEGGLGGFDSDIDNGVQVDYQTDISGEKHSIPSLTPHVPQPYGDGAFSMQYLPPDES